MRTTAGLLAELRGQALAEGEARISALLASTRSRHDGIGLVDSGVYPVRDTREETNPMNIDPRIYAWQYHARLLCADCLVERLIEQGKAAPAARDMAIEDVIEQIQESDAADTLERLDSGNDVSHECCWHTTDEGEWCCICEGQYPQPLGAYSGLTEEDLCWDCEEVLYE